MHILFQKLEKKVFVTKFLKFKYENLHIKTTCLIMKMFFKITTSDATWFIMPKAWINAYYKIIYAISVQRFSAFQPSKLITYVNNQLVN